MVLFLLASYSLARWLYPDDPLPSTPSESTVGQP
jgi:hypothetical protein